jgi:hypothetical protein
LTPDYALVSVASLQEEFTQSLPIATREAIHRGGSTTPQAQAYNWLFHASNPHPDLPEGEAMARMTHRFALATIYDATGGDASWKVNEGWLDSAKLAKGCSAFSWVPTCSQEESRLR